MHIKTKRLFIRPLAFGDEADFLRINLDFHHSIYRDYDGEMPLTLEDMKREMADYVNSQQYYCVFLNDVVIGHICCRKESYHDQLLYDIGFCFDSKYHHQGYGYEAVNGLMAYYNQKDGVSIFTAGTAMVNLPARRLLSRLGFRMFKIGKVSFYKDENGNPIYFDGGFFVKRY